MSDFEMRYYIKKLKKKADKELKKDARYNAYKEVYNNRL